MIKQKPFNLKVSELKPKQQTEDLLHSHETALNDVIKELKQFKSFKTFQNIERMEKRLQQVNFQIPKLGGDDEQRNQIIQNWFIDVCKTIFSVGFNMYESGILNTNKVKAYCSENILRNLLLLSEQNNLSPKQIKNINNLLQKDLLPYFCQIYPESQENETSAKFSSDLIERDTMEQNDYDLIYKSQVDFSYQTNGDYNMAIMKFLNYIIGLTSTKEQKDNEEIEINTLFEKDMSELFRKVQSEQNLLNMLQFNLKNSSNNFNSRNVKFQKVSEKQKQQYEREVREYTNFKIGQKLSKNLQPFSSFEIESGDLKLKNSEMIRVVTKWCEQLESVFDPKTIMSKQVLFRMQNGQQKYVRLSQRKKLIQLLLAQKEKIVSMTKQQINENNYQNQSNLMQTNVNKYLQRFSKNDAIVGQFCPIIHKNNVNYLITYLNALIHAINKAVRKYKFFEDKITKTSETIPALISFKIGDLLRCKCESKEMQIIALYKQIERLHRQPNSILKIIRVKNRLNKGNKDILINLLYRNKMVVEMQLAIKSGNSKFIEKSYNFNHYLYELRRAPFGPIMEMCNVWINKDFKSQFYVNKMEDLNKRFVTELTQKDNNLRSRKLETCCIVNKKSLILPFRCSICTCFYSEINFNLANILCDKCGNKICYLCQLQLSQKTKQAFFTNVKRKIDFSLTQVSILKNPLSQIGGVLLNLKDKKKLPIVFLTVLQKDEYYMLQYIDSKDQVKLIYKFPSQIVPESFHKSNIVLTSPQIQKKVKNLHQRAQSALSAFFLGSYLKEAKRKEKTFVSLMSKGLSKQKILSKDTSVWTNVTKLNISQNKDLKQINWVVQKFPNVKSASLNSINLECLPLNIWVNLKYLLISDNNLKHLKNLENCLNLQQLDFRSNKVQQFPEQITKLTKLKSLTMNDNQLTHISKSIQKLQQLQYLCFSKNKKISQIPEQIGNLKQLKLLQFYSNSVQKIPSSIGKLSNLVQLSMGSNNLSYLPQQIGNLSNLGQLFVGYNKIKQLPKTIANLKSLFHLSVQGNKGMILCEEIGKLKSLKILALNDIELTQFPKFICNLENLWYLLLGNNKVQQLPNEINKLENLQYLYLYHNRIKELPASIGDLSNLKTLCLTNNQLNSFPQSIKNLRLLRFLRFTLNKFDKFPEAVTNLTSLQFLIMRQNDIKRLSPNIGKLKYLKMLSAVKCGLQKLPDQVFTLQNLQQLYLTSNNELKIQSQKLNKLSKLQVLFISDIKFIDVPTNISKLKTLKQIKSDSSVFLQLPLQYMNGSLLKKYRISSIQEKPQRIFDKISEIQNPNLQILISSQVPGLIQKYKNVFQNTKNANWNVKVTFV